jgi:DNA invertase Pin-like site-specific DNA recombinase
MTGNGATLLHMVTKFTQQTIDKYRAMEEELNEFYRQRNEEIVRSYGDGNNGWTYKELATKFGLSRQRVSRIIKEGKEG